MKIAEVTEADIDELLVLLRAYCDFHEVAPSDDDLKTLVRALLDDPAQGVQLLARDDACRAIGFATIYWKWTTTRAGRAALMNDLYTEPDQRGKGVGASLIDACLQRARAAGVLHLEWITALDNETAQRLYDRVAPGPRDWRHYRIDTAI